jgi:hypothetical protein
MLGRSRSVDASPIAMACLYGASEDFEVVQLAAQQVVCHQLSYLAGSGGGLGIAHHNGRF